MFYFNHIKKLILRVLVDLVLSTILYFKFVNKKIKVPFYLLFLLFFGLRIFFVLHNIQHAEGDSCHYLFGLMAFFYSFIC